MNPKTILTTRTPIDRINCIVRKAINSLRMVGTEGVGCSGTTGVFCTFND